MDLPLRCVDPIIKYCQGCKYGWVRYPSWVENREDLVYCFIESGCTLGFDTGRIEDEPTKEELEEFESWLSRIYEDY